MPKIYANRKNTKNKSNLFYGVWNYKPTPRKSLWIIIAIVLLFVFVPNIYNTIAGSPRSYTNSEASTYLSEYSKKLSLPGELMYENVQDAGCGESYTYSEGTRYAYDACFRMLMKFYKNHGDIGADLELTEDILLKNGLKRKEELPSSSFDDAMTGKNDIGGKLEYSSSSKDRIYAMVIFVAGGNAEKNALVKDILNLENDINLSKDDYVYGVFVGRSYKDNLPNSQQNKLLEAFNKFISLP